RSLGLPEAAEVAWKSALDDARAAGADGYVWRALAALGQYDAALRILEQIPPTEYGVSRGEIRQRFAPRLEQLAAKDAEAAFALLEKLSELERVQVLGQSVLGLADPATRAALAAAAPHLAEMDRVRAKIATAQAADKEYLDLRLRQEQALVDDLLGKEQERLPEFYHLAGAGVLQLAAAAAALQGAAENAVAGEGDAEIRQRFTEVQTAYHKECGGSKGGRLCRILTPLPVEAIDILEKLPGRTMLRFTPLDERRWLLFTLGGKAGIRSETVDKAGLESRLAATPQDLAAFVEPQQFGAATVATWWLSASHLLRAIEQRRPFRRQILDPGGSWADKVTFTRHP